MRSGSWAAILLTYAFGVVAAATTTEVIPLHALFQAANMGTIFPWMLALIGLPAAVVAGVSGGLIDRFAPRSVLMAGALIGVVTNVLFAVAASPAVFVAGRLVEGLALVCIFTAAPALLMATTEGRRRISAMTLWSTFSPIGVSLGFALGAMSASRSSLNLAFGVHAALFAMMVPLGLALPRRTGVVGTASVPGLRRRLLALGDAYRQIAVVQLAAAFLLVISLGFGVSITLPGYYSVVHGMTAAQASGLLGGGNLAMVPGSFAAGALLARGWSPGRLLKAAAVVGITMGLLLILPGTPERVLFPLLIVWAASLGWSTATLLATLPRVADPARLGAAAGLISQASALATVVNPPIWLTLLRLGSWTPFLVLIVVGWVAAAGLVDRALIVRSRQSPAAA